MDCSYGGRDLSIGTFTFVVGALIAEKGGSPELSGTWYASGLRQGRWSPVSSDQCRSRDRDAFEANFWGLNPDTHSHTHTS